MRHFDDILAIASERHGGREAALADIPVPKSADEIAAVPDAQWLASMTKGISQAGISWKVIEAKWDGIEEAFLGFDISRILMQPDDWFYDLCNDTRVIRSPPKIRAILDNALFIRQVSDAHGSFGRKLADWPRQDFAGLLAWLKSEGSRLGGTTGAYVLRYNGVDSYVMTPDVVARLVAEGIVDKAPSSKKAWAAVSEAFNIWAAQSGLTLTTISRVLARSVG